MILVSLILLFFFWYAIPLSPDEKRKWKVKRKKQLEIKK